MAYFVGTDTQGSQCKKPKQPLSICSFRLQSGQSRIMSLRACSPRQVWDLEEGVREG